MCGCHQTPPLNSDAFTKWGVHDPDFDKHIADVKKATKILVQSVVPKYAQFLCEFMERKTPDERLSFPLETETHKRGN